MNEARQVFIEDIQEKNKAKPAHIVSKTGPRVNYEEKSGKVARVNPTKRISYEEFKSLDKHEKALYAQMVVDQWQIGVGTFATMFGCDAGNLYRMFKQPGLPSVANLR